MGELPKVRPTIRGVVRKGPMIMHGSLVSQCKSCDEAIRSVQDRIWSTRPIGLVHLLCATLHNLPTAGRPTYGFGNKK